MNRQTRTPLRPDYSAARVRTSAPIFRSATAMLLHNFEKKQKEFDAVLKQRWPNDATTDWLARSAATVGTSTSPTWAAELAGRGISDIISILAPASAGAAAMARGLQFQFTGGFDSIAVPGLLAAKTDAGFVTQGQSIPIRKFDTG